MSVQLIVYPQSYNGQSNTLSSSPTELVVNGISFSNLDNTGSYTSTVAPPYVDTLTNAAPSIVNTWNRFRKGSIAFPTVVVGDLVLVGGSSEISGIYQELSNLTIGGQYTITINIPVAVAGGFVGVRVYLGTSLQAETTYNSNVTQISNTFFAASTELTIMISYYNAASSNLTISNISTQPVIGAVPSGSTSILDDGQVICDLYEDEDLPLTLSVDDFKNVAEQVQSYSKAFNLPATKRNNKIFDQIFEITRSYDGVIFNPYKKTECVLKQNGFTLFQGYLRMLDITDKNGEISYNVNLYSEVIALADYLKDRTFSDLDFSELTHDYNFTSIKNTWQGINIFPNPSTSGFRDGNTLRYPFVDWNHQFTVGTAGFPVLPNLEAAFRPFINIKYLIDRIFQDTPFTYTSEFFNLDTTTGGAFDFDRLFMDFNWGADNSPVVFDSLNALTNYNDFNLPTSYTTLPFDTMLLAGGTIPSANFGYSAGVFTAQENGQVYTLDYNFAFEWDQLTGLNDELSVELVINGISQVGAYNIPYNIFGYTFAGTFTTIPLQAGDTILFRAKSLLTLIELSGVFSVFNVTPSLITISTSVAQTTSDTLLETLRGELGQWDFLKGLMTMFNLITIPDENNSNNIIIEPYVDVFINTKGTTLQDRTIQHDWTEKIDVSEMKLEPLADLNKRTIFKFVEDDDDYAFTQYKNSTGGHLYGSKKYNAGNEFNILEGLDEIVAEPFAATVVKPLMSQFPDFIVPSLYSYNANDDTSEGFENSPRIMFNNGAKTLTSCTYNVPAQNGGVQNALEDEFLQFSHLTNIPTIVSDPPAATDSRDFHFGECQLISGVGNASAYNLFNMYWLPYYSELYNPDTRIMTIKVNLSPSDINTFKFNDKVFIKNRIFRVNKIDYKPNDLAKVEFILIP
tara:strand:+ start:326 stop:3055 length:2730 start_codon:yes stop_codon:yes gene_type:complete